MLLGISFNVRKEVSPVHRTSTHSLNSLQSHFGCVRHSSPFPRAANIKRTRPALSILLASRRREPLCNLAIYKLQTMDWRQLLAKHMYIRHSWIDFLWLGNFSLSSSHERCQSNVFYVTGTPVLSLFVLLVRNYYYFSSFPRHFSRQLSTQANAQSERLLKNNTSGNVA